MQQDPAHSHPSIYAGEISLEDCLKILGVHSNYSLEDLTRQFSLLSKRFHPDVDSSYRTEYFRVLKSYDLLKNALSRPVPINEPVLETRSEKPRVILPQPVTNVTSALQYTITLDWLDIFTSWSLYGKYQKNIRYGFHKTCTCEELCVVCRGTGVVHVMKCPTCTGKGWVHFCDECKGCGLYTKKEVYTLTLPYGLPIPKEICVENKGDVLTPTKRGPLLLTINFLDNVRQIKPGVFINTVYISLDDLKKPYLEFNLAKGQSVYISTRDITEIPYKKDLNQSFNIEYDSRKIKLYLHLKLDLTSNS